MKNKRTTRFIALLLVLIMALSLIIVAIDALTAGAYVTQSEIDRLREEMREYERRKLEILSRINTIEFERMTEVAKKNVLDDRIYITGLEIENMENIIENYVLLIAEKELEVLDAINMEEEQFNIYKNRVRDMEENGVITYLEIIFDSTSFADLLARIDFVSDIMQADEKTYFDLIAARERTIKAKEDLEIAKIEMENEKVLMEKKLLELADQVEQANQLIQQIEDNLETESALYAAESAEAERIQNEINKKIEELRAQEAAQNAARVRGTGELMWPVPSSSNITSQFGTRLHPVYKVYRTHLGIDIAADYGKNVIAADTGTVIISEYNSSYGHYVVISHGNMTTLYAHLSSRAVSVGDTIRKGEVLGYIGSTGVSTGPHLHFEVSVDGVKVDPERYL
ncbi:MAG: peptidoglycan DD-metalloendopeptidase family protein [Oscillospiraceae bacterium]|nr:peptidoglycan DD-metalloendopeptidase family protein [Oscillospiraceae bacterium]